MMLAYTFTGVAGRVPGWTSGAGRTLTGPVGAACSADVAGPTYGVVQTTAKTTPAGLSITSVKSAATTIRIGRDRRRETRELFVREVFQLGGQLAHPATIIEAPDEATVTLISCHVEELLLRNQRSKAGKVRIRVVAHDPANNAGELAPLAFRQRLAIAGDGDEQRGSGAGDRVGQKLLSLRPRDDLATGADDVCDPVTPHPDDVAPAPNRGAFEISRSCFHHRLPILVCRQWTWIWRPITRASETPSANLRRGWFGSMPKRSTATIDSPTKPSKRPGLQGFSESSYLASTAGQAWMRSPLPFVSKSWRRPARRPRSSSTYTRASGANRFCCLALRSRRNDGCRHSRRASCSAP